MLFENTDYFETIVVQKVGYLKRQLQIRVREPKVKLKSIERECLKVEIGIVRVSN